MTPFTMFIPLLFNLFSCNLIITFLKKEQPAEWYFFPDSVICTISSCLSKFYDCAISSFVCNSTISSSCTVFSASQPVLITAYMGFTLTDFSSLIYVFLPWCSVLYICLNVDSRFQDLCFFLFWRISFKVKTLFSIFAFLA